MVGNLLVDKSRAFALKSIRAYEYLQNKCEYILSKQFLRSATSIGANIAEGQYAQSKADFLAKYSIALKEASETQYWLDLLVDAGYLSDSCPKTERMSDCSELVRLLSASIKKLKNIK